MKQFQPNYKVNETILQSLIKIEQYKNQCDILPMTPEVLSGLQETAKLYITHLSTQIEGNLLELNEVNSVIKDNLNIGRERDQREVKGYYAALQYVENIAKQETQISENTIKKIHSIVMNNGNINIKPTPYRNAQNVIRNSIDGKIIYMPPEAKDVPQLMKQLIEWITNSNDLPKPIIAAIAHYQFVTIHPYFDGNGRTARLLTTLILHSTKYDLKGLYSLEEYYANDLNGYYNALNIGISHNYYLGREQAEITSWIQYFCKGMELAFRKVINQMTKLNTKGKLDKSETLKSLSPQQRKVLRLFKNYNTITNNQLSIFFKISPRAASNLSKKWVEQKFLEITDISKKSRKYSLNKQVATLFNKH